MTILTFNIGGTIFQSEKTTLQSITNTRLSNISLLSGNYNKEKDYYFFDRDPVVFSYILNYCRTGELHLPSDLCSTSIRRELDFWQIPEGSVAECCWKTLNQMKDVECVTTEMNKLFHNERMDHSVCTDDMTRVRKVLHSTWMFLEYPKSSFAAKIWEFFMYTLVVISTTLFLMESVNDLRYQHPLILQRCNLTNISVEPLIDQSFDGKLTYFLKTRPLSVLEKMDSTLTSIFLLELILRFISCPRKCKFLHGILNIADFIYLVCKYPSTYMERNTCITGSIAMVYLVVKSFTVVRLIRLFRIVRSCSGLKVMALAFKASLNELFLMLVTLGCVTVLFGAGAYFAEIKETTFKNMFHACWWAVITMTTVGYGDVVPVTPFGNIVGTACALVGLLILTLPIAVIGTKFGTYYAVNENRSVFSKQDNCPLNTQTQTQTQSS